MPFDIGPDDQIDVEIGEMKRTFDVHNEMKQKGMIEWEIIGNETYNIIKRIKEEQGNLIYFVNWLRKKGESENDINWSCASLQVLNPGFGILGQR